MPCLSQVGGNYFYGQKRFFPNIDFLRSRIIQGFSKLLYFPFLMFIFPKGVTSMRAEMKLVSSPQNPQDLA